jgi:hypothetical protein
MMNQEIVAYDLEDLTYRRKDGTYVGVVRGMPYHIIPEDIYGLWEKAVVIADEMGDDLPFEPERVIEPYNPLLCSLTARQFRLSLLRASITSSMITAEIAKITAPLEREEMTVEWEYATEYKRDNKLVQFISTSLLSSSPAMDEIWKAGLRI